MQSLRQTKHDKDEEKNFNFSLQDAYMDYIQLHPIVTNDFDLASNAEYLNRIASIFFGFEVEFFQTEKQKKHGNLCSDPFDDELFLHLYFKNKNMIGNGKNWVDTTNVVLNKFIQDLNKKLEETNRLNNELATKSDSVPNTPRKI